VLDYQSDTVQFDPQHRTGVSLYGEEVRSQLAKNLSNCSLLFENALVETITVQAGTFKACKTVEQWVHGEHQMRVTWYSPEVPFGFVKVSGPSSYSIELVNFSMVGQ